MARGERALGGESEAWLRVATLDPSALSFSLRYLKVISNSLGSAVGLASVVAFLSGWLEIPPLRCWEGGSGALGPCQWAD